MSNQILVQQEETDFVHAESPEEWDTKFQTIYAALQTSKNKFYDKELNYIQPNKFYYETKIKKEKGKQNLQMIMSCSNGFKKILK